jgi:hypothetical protein
VLGSEEAYTTLAEGQVAEWEKKRNRPDPSKVQAAKDRALASKDEKKRLIREFVTNKNTNEFYGRDIGSLIKDWVNDNKKLKSTVENFEEYLRPKGVTSSDMQLSYAERLASDRSLHQAMNEVAQEKIGKLVNSGNLDALLRAAGVDKGTLPHRKLKELILLDDWNELAPMAEPMIYSGGPEAIDILYDRYIKNTGITLLPYSGTGLSITDYDNNNIEKPNKIVTIPGHNTRSELLKSMASYQHLTIDAVNRDYVATVICPERFVYRNPVLYPRKTALVSGSTGFILRSDENGNTAAWINPYMPTIGTTTTGKFFAAYNPTEFNPQTGEWTAATYLPAPLLSHVDNFQFFKLNSASFRLTPLQSQMNSSGNFQIAFIDLYGGGQPIIPQQGVMQNAYYQTGNGLTTYRGINLPIDNSNFMHYKNYSVDFQGGFYILLTGCEPETNIAKIDIFYNYEIIPTTTETQFSVVDLPIPGVRTAEFLSNMNSVLPGLQMLSYEEALTLATRLRNTSPQYDEQFEAVMNFVIEHVPAIAKATGLSRRSIY